MKLRQIMSQTVIRIHPEEPVEAAARTLARFNIGALPVCSGDGQLCGMVTDRDIVTRCIASGKTPANTRVAEVMSGGVVSATGDMEAAMAAELMGKHQVRRLPVLENGRLCGMVSLSDLAGCKDSNMEAADALGRVSNNIKNF